MSESAVEPDADGSAQGHHPRRALSDAQRHLLDRALKLAIYLLVPLGMPTKLIARRQSPRNPFYDRGSR